MNRLFKMAVMAGVEKAVRLHIDRGDDLNGRDDKGLTPLMIAASRNRANICRLLLAAKANPRLLDPLGRDALAIAVGAGARDAEAVLLLALAPPAKERTPSQIAPQPEASTHASEADDDAEFDHSGWAEEEETTEPAETSTDAPEAAAAQAAISSHAPIDSAASWDEFEIALPSFAQPLSSVSDAERAEGLRPLLLRAMREGSVPSQLVDEFSLSESSEDTSRALQWVINALGAEVDERFEYRSDYEDFTVWIDLAASEDEEELLREAFTAVHAMEADDHGLLWMFLREAQMHPLLTPSEEIILGQTMEAELGRALDALAGWPAGIDALLEAARQARTSKRILGSIAVESGDEVPTDERNLGVDPAELFAATDPDPADADAASEPNAALDLDAALAKLETLPRADGVDAKGWADSRALLGSISFRREFLLGLADGAARESHSCARLYLEATRRLARARDQLALSNLRLVVSIARKYRNSGLPLEDLVQDGNIGLLRAVDKFDWRRGFHFSTYAIWWIRQAVSRSVADTSRFIRIPVHFHQAVYAAQREARSWEQEHGRPPTPLELAQSLSLPIRKVEQILRANEPPASLEELLNRDDVGADLREALTLPDPCISAEDRELTRELDSLISPPAFTTREQQVIRMRFGFGVESEKTLEEIGLAMHLTRERIRQIEVKTLRKLKHPSRTAALRAWTAQEEKPPEAITKEGAVSDDEPVEDSAPRDAADDLDSELLTPDDETEALR